MHNLQYIYDNYILSYKLDIHKFMKKCLKSWRTKQDVLLIDNIILNHKEYSKLYDMACKDFDISRIVKDNNRDYQRFYRLRNRITDILDMQNAYFITLTLKDDTIDDILLKTYVSRTLKKCSYNYVANIDYGLKNERKHYHAVASIPDLELFNWDLGFFTLLPIKTNSDASRIAMYVSKLVNHSIKKTTRSTVIYSRQRKKNNLKLI